MEACNRKVRNSMYHYGAEVNNVNYVKNVGKQVPCFGQVSDKSINVDNIINTNYHKRDQIYSLNGCNCEGCKNRQMYDGKNGTGCNHGGCYSMLL
jgi:hypothetical protein